MGESLEGRKTEIENNKSATHLCEEISRKQLILAENDMDLEVKNVNLDIGATEGPGGRGAWVMIIGWKSGSVLFG